jgi:hypothetical protein
METSSYLIAVRIIALMLGRLGMTIKDCKKAYEELVKIVFGDQKFIVYCRAFRTYATSSFRIRRKIVAGFYRYRSEVLERAIGDYLDTHGWGPNEPLIPSVNHPTQCRV